MKKYIIFCRHCGAVLMKTENNIISVLLIEIKCPNKKCKRLLRFPEDVLIELKEKNERR